MMCVCKSFFSELAGLIAVLLLVAKAVIMKTLLLSESLSNVWFN